MNFLEELNPIQQEAVRSIEGPNMIIAGAGSGKTRVLTYRIAYMMSEGIDPFNILSLTFTNKAAKEMRHRVQQLVSAEARNLWIGTFHSVFARILRTDAPCLGYPTNFSIYDTDDSKSLIKLIIKEQNLNDQIYKPNTILNRISSAKNSLIDPKTYQNDSMIQAEDAGAHRPKLGELYELYWKRCFQAGAMDFDDLLFKMYLLLENYPESLYKYQHLFKFILIDEFQDTNFAQYEIIKKLGDVYQNICVVGDDAQSIYSFRGATIHNILNFTKDYPETKTFKLEQNYRSTKNIISAANEVITNNKKQHLKQLWTENHEGEKIKVVRSLSDNEEGRMVADNIHENKLVQHFKNNDFVILYRTNAQSRSFEEALRKLNIAYRVYGGIAFYQRKEIKDFLSFLRLTVNHFDEEALRRIINYPARGIGQTTLEKITIIADSQDIRIWEVIENIKQYDFSEKTKILIDEFVTMIKSFAVMLKNHSAFDLAMHIAKSTSILKELYNDKTIEGLSRYENTQELLNGIKEFTETSTNNESINDQQPETVNSKPETRNSLPTYLQEITLLTDADNDKSDNDKVKLMTIHAAKGLEFPVVYVVGMEENLFPSMMSLNSRDDLEEERRLFYVAITRAKQKLWLTYAASRYRFGNLMYNEPSRFIEEIPSSYIVKTGVERKVNQKENNPIDKIFFTKKTQTVHSNFVHVPSTDFRADEPATLQTGMEVEHQRFGFGKVLHLEGEPSNKIATIFFQNVGQKKIMLKYAKLKIHVGNLMN